MADNRYSIYPASFVYAGGVTTLNVAQILDVNDSLNVTRHEFIAGGALDRAAVIAVQAEPQVTFSSGDIATLLTAVSPTIGLSVTNGSTFRYQKRANAGTFAGSTTNVTTTSSTGFLFPTQIAANQDDAEGAKLELTYIPFSSDGLTAPLVSTSSVDFTAAPAPAFTAQHYFGPVYINSVLLDGVTGFTVDFGLDFQVFRASGQVFAMTGHLISRKPKITINTTNLDAIATIGTMFNNAAAGVVACYLWKGNPGGTRVAAATAQHIKLSFATSTIGPDTVQVNQNDNGTVSFSVFGTGTIAYNGATAIP